MAFCDRLLSHWVTQYTHPEKVDIAFYAGLYAAGSLSFVFFMITSGFAVGIACVATSKALHDSCINHLMHAPVSYFEATPSGRILSRFGADLAMVDGMLANFTEATMTMLLTLVVLCAIISVVAPLMLPILLVAGMIFAFQVVAQDRTNRQAKRMANNALSPVLNCLGELGESHGKLLVRVMDFSDRYMMRFDAALDSLNELTYMSTLLLNCGCFLSYLLAAAISATAAYVMLTIVTTTPADLGLALTYSFMLPYFLQMLAQIAGSLKLGMTSLERLLQCQGEEVPQEPAWELPRDAKLLAPGWPECGEVCFENITLVYRPGLPPSVKNCTFTVPGGSKVGVVGRTGAGKSSLFVLLFRLVDPAEGRILIDGIPTCSVGLLMLRRSMVIIPQEPLLLEGTVRSNIDPFGQVSPQKVSEALKKVGLGDHEETEPRHLSAGQKQLLQMARAILRGVRIVVMDEPTSNVDPNTDKALQNLAREELRDRTMITIAHRLDTVIDADRVLVLEKGSVAEYGPPSELLSARGSGAFAAMVDGEGKVRAQELRRRAAAPASDKLRSIAGSPSSAPKAAFLPPCLPMCGRAS
mmetsp:Transcript_71180/g.152155  ORF Transcript_71180/g.152155 Transcript_71180/m.152155 type:complete len:583 (+) Transcript_71180:23-1771(+)